MDEAVAEVTLWEELIIADDPISEVLGGGLR